MCWEAAFVQGDILQGIGVEDGEETHHVVDIVDRHTVEEQQVLVGTAATHIHACRGFRAVLHTWQQLDGFQHVGFAKQSRDAFNLLHGQLYHTHLGAAGTHRGTGGLHNHFIELNVGGEGEVHGEVFLQFKGFVSLVVAHIRHLQVHLTLVQGQCVEAVTICSTAFA